MSMSMENERLVSEFFNPHHQRGIVKEILEDRLIVVDLETNQEVIILESPGVLDYFSSLDEEILVTYDAQTLELVIV